MNREMMLRKVQMLGFAVVETNLYLNTHPDDVAALKYYEKYSNLYKEAVSEFENNYGPLTNKGIKINDGWSWIYSPWPWEPEV